MLWITDALLHDGPFADMVALGYGALNGTLAFEETVDGRLRKTRLQANLDDVTVKTYVVNQEQTGMCPGDSGGPFILEMDGYLFLAGVMSRVYPKLDDRLRAELKAMNGDVDRLRERHPHLDWCAYRGAFVNMQYYAYWLKDKLAELGYELKDFRDE
jgi:hypothetical protein